MRIFNLLVVAGLACLSSIHASSSERISLNAGWRFQKGDPSGVGDALSYDKIKDWLLPTGNSFTKPEEAKKRPDGNLGGQIEYTQTGFNDSGWRQLNLPHDWGIEGPFDQSLPGETGKLPWSGVGWYRKHFQVDAENIPAQKYYLDIDGAMSYSSVWCNGKFVGGWPYGYASYRLDLTPYIKSGTDNVLAIRLDNPPESSRWYPGGGIYRNVWLVKTQPVHVAQWGTFVDASSSDIKVQTTLRNDSAEEVVCSLTSTVMDAGKAHGAVTEPTIKIAAGEEKTVSQTIPLARGSAFVRLWSLKDPYLYKLVSQVTSDGRSLDIYETNFGIRKVEFTADKGLQINGQQVKIQGVCQHHDLGALGSAINVRALERQIQILKEMGCNAIRTSHNPPAPELLDLCDRMGMLVMDEFVDCWVKQKKPNGYNQIFAEWAERDVRAFVRRDRNHPSVILWSIGNEIPEQSASEGPAMEKQLSAYVRMEDPTRPTTIGVSDTKGGYNGFQTGVDIFGYNYKPGEYKKFREANPAIPLFGSETSSTISSRGEYFFPVTDKKGEGKSDFQMSSYDLYAPGWATLPDWEFKGQDQNPFVAGEFVWTGFDYLGEPTPYNGDSTNLLNYHTPEAKAAAEKELKEMGKIKVPSRSSYFGIVDLAGFKKDRFYLYQSRWKPELPMAHILPHWNWTGREGEVTPVHVYTSGDEAELFLNGKSLGRKKKAEFEYRLRWDDVKYEAGELKVVAYKGGKEWARDIVKTTGPAAKLLLQPDRTAIQADGNDLSFVTLTVADAEGKLVPQTHNSIQFEVEGPGEIVATDNGDATDQVVFSSHERKAFNGLALVIVRAQPGAAEPIRLRAKSEGLPVVETILTPVK
ncbi:MAG: beta-galactosidase GalB [Chthoniobacterales bacterium]